jgi:hypothetical protein
MRKTVVALLLAGTLFFGAAGCGSAPGSEGAATPDLSNAPTGEIPTTATAAPAATTDVSSSSTTETTPAADVKIGALGERRNPIPVGQEAQVADWKVRVVGATLNATQTILDENMFNDPPEDGSQYVLVSLEATYNGQESSTFWLDMTYSFVGGRGSTFGTGAAVAPDSMTDQGEASPGASIAGNLLFEVASDQVSDGTLLLEKAFSFEETRVFFAVE